MKQSTNDVFTIRCTGKKKFLTYVLYIRNKVPCLLNKTVLKTFKYRGIIYVLIQHCSSAAPQIPLCRRMLEFNPGLLRLQHWQSEALTTQRDFIHKARSYPRSYLYVKLLIFLKPLFMDIYFSNINRNSSQNKPLSNNTFSWILILNREKLNTVPYSFKKMLKKRFLISTVFRPLQGL